MKTQTHKIKFSTLKNVVPITIGIKPPLFIISFLIMMFFSLSSLICNAQSSKSVLNKQTRTLIHLLDYVSQDYAQAVNNGEIINATEYAEMLDFSNQAISLFNSISLQVNIVNKDTIEKQLLQLLILIKQKSDETAITTKGQQLKKQILLLHLIDISPEQYPDISKGKNVFFTNCISCHGSDGASDGQLSASFTPRPASFLDDSLMQHVSPLQVFNTARIGLKGTAMRAFDELSDKEVWDVAFYIKSLRFQKKHAVNNDSLHTKFSDFQSTVPLSDIAQLSDKELTEKLNSNHPENYLAAVRLHQPSVKENNSLNVAINKLDEALMFYKIHNNVMAGEKALYAYLDGVNPVEKQLSATDPSIVSELENKMNLVRIAIKANRPILEVEQKINDAKLSISKATLLLNEQTYSFWFSFLIASSILLREGLEAVLIIFIILTVLKTLKAKDAIKWVHFGWITAVFIGLASWFLTDWLIYFGAKNREMMEGFGSVIAVIILMYMGFWLHRKTETKKWTQFIEGRITQMIDNGKMFGLAFISFIVVFREAFESIIFLSSLQLQVNTDSKNGVWLGALAAIFIVIIVAYLLLKFSTRIPFKKLFQYSSISILILAIFLAGKGIHAFQESGWISVTNVPFNFYSSVLGIYPTMETYMTQFIILLFTILMWRYGNKRMVSKK